MTISYAGEVPNGSNFGCFWKILWKWRGSVYKLVWRELLAYLAVYYALNFLYRYGLNEDQKRYFDNVQTYIYYNFRIFEKLRQYFGAQSESIPMSFVLGFYVSLIVKRWWEQYKLLPWPDTLALFISAAIPQNDERGRMMRRNIMRYSVMAYVITLMRISLRVKRRFPTHQHLVDAGIMLDSEKKIFEIMDGKSPMSKYWMPLVWATNIINRARKEKIIESDHIVQTLLVELSDIRRRLGALIGYDTVCVPLVYTQVVTLVLYTYFVAALLGRQMIPKDANTLPSGLKYEDPDLYFPLFTALQFCFYVGWLKVAEVLINPFGEDDDDIELNWLIDRHIKASYMIVDEMHNEHPELLKDQYWNQVVPEDLPYTVASEHYRKSEPKGSAENYKIKQADAMYANIGVAKRSHQAPDDAYADYESVDTPMPERRRNWLSRQITRIGSIRSSSTAYSSGLYKAGGPRKNSVYSSPEPVLPGQMMPPPASHKMSFSKKARQLMKTSSRPNLNGAVATAAQLKNRPRIPTPDVTKEGMEKENRFNLSAVPSTSAVMLQPGSSGIMAPGASTSTGAGSQHQLHPLHAHQHGGNIGVASASGIGGAAAASMGAGGGLAAAMGASNIAAGVALAARKLATEPSVYRTDFHLHDEISPIANLLLSPIKELDSGSVNNTLHPGSPTTVELARALQKGGQFGSITTTTTMPNSPSLTRITVFPTRAGHHSPQPQTHEVSVAITTLPVVTSRHQAALNPQHNVIITEVQPDSVDDVDDTLDDDDVVIDTIDEVDEADRSAMSVAGAARRSAFLARQNSDGAASVQHAQLRQMQPVAENATSSAPSTLAKQKPETKTGEVYV